MEPIQITKIHEQHYHDQHLDLDFGNKTALLDSEPLTLTPQRIRPTGIPD
jgi:hypothetical protein